MTTTAAALRRYVYPEIKRRGLQDQWLNALLFERPGDGYDLMWFIATADPAVLAEAAAIVLEGSK